MNRKIVTETDGKKKATISEKIRAEIEEKYKKEIEESFREERENFRLKVEQEKKSLEDEYETKRENLERELKNQKRKNREELERKASESQKKIDDERNAFEKQKEQELEKIIKREQEAEERVNQEKERCSNEIQKIRLETNEAIRRKNDEIKKLNDIIQEKNNKEAELQALREKVSMLEGIIKQRETKKEEDITSSIFEVSKTGKWYEIGYMRLEEKKDPKDFKFPENKVLSYYTQDEIYPDGVIIESGKKTNVIAKYEIVKENDVYRNFVKFYSDSRVVPIYNLLGFLNFILHIYQAGFKIDEKKNIQEMKIQCLVYSEEKLEKINSELFKADKIDTYLLSYKDNKYTNIGILAKTLYRNMHCSKKGIPNETIDRIEDVSLQKGMQISRKGKYIKPLQYLPDNNIEQTR